MSRVPKHIHLDVKKTQSYTGSIKKSTKSFTVVLLLFVCLFVVLCCVVLLLTFLLSDSKISILVQIRAQEIKLLLLFTLGKVFRKSFNKNQHKKTTTTQNNTT